MTETFPHLWHSLTQAFAEDATAARVEELAAHFAARVGGALYNPCLGLFSAEVVARYYGVVYLLGEYGIALRRRDRADGEGVFLYAEVKELEPSEFAGARVWVKRPAALLRPVA